MQGLFDKELGQSGEEAAAQFLTGKGYKILERNYRCRMGEIDLIAEKNGKILFVEVKTRRSVESVSPKELIPLGKQKKISKVAQYYIAQKKFHDRSADFGALLIDWSGTRPQMELIEGAFSLAWGY